MCDYAYNCKSFNTHGTNCNSHKGVPCTDYDPPECVDVPQASVSCSTKPGQFKRGMCDEGNNGTVFRLLIEGGNLCIRVNGDEHKISSRHSPDTTFWVSYCNKEILITNSIPKGEQYVLIGMLLTDDKGEWEKCRRI